MSRFFNIPRFRVILKCVRDYPKIRKCRNEAIRVKELGYYDQVPGQLGLVNDIINSPLRRFSDFSLRWAFHNEYGITADMLQRSPNTRRTVSRPWGSPDELFMLEHYSSSMNTDPLKMSPTARTVGEQAKKETGCQ